MATKNKSEVGHDIELMIESITIISVNLREVEGFTKERVLFELGKITGIIEGILTILEERD